jgi:hypothetical protein
MKYLKSFESKNIESEINFILDKILKFGKKSLTPAENRLLKGFYKGEHEEFIKDLEQKRKKINDIRLYNPQEEEMILKRNMDRSFVPMEYTEDMLEYDRYAMMWDEMDEEDIDHFVEYCGIKDINNPDRKTGQLRWVVDVKKTINCKEVYKPWDELDDSIQRRFINYINEVY